MRGGTRSGSNTSKRSGMCGGVRVSNIRCTGSSTRPGGGIRGRDGGSSGNGRSNRASRWAASAARSNGGYSGFSRQGELLRFIGNAAPDRNFPTSKLIWTDQSNYA